MSFRHREIAASAASAAMLLTSCALTTSFDTYDSAVATRGTLASLTLSVGPIYPAFDTDTLDYRAGPFRVAALLPASGTTVTATVGHAGETLTINGVPTESGAPSASFPVLAGDHTIDIAVTSADRGVTTHYTITVSGNPNDYLKASNTRAGASFGHAVALSHDGNSLVVGAPFEYGSTTGINGDQSLTGGSSGAAYVFVRTGSSWSQQAYVKASNTREGAQFGASVSISGDGNTLAIGDPYESSAATGVDGNQADTSAERAGAVYVFARAGATWSQQAYLKASNARAKGSFGWSVALSDDGDTLAVGSAAPAAPYGESSAATGIAGDQANQSAPAAGAVYVFARAGTSWSQQAYVKASNTRADAELGFSVALSNDGNLLAAGSLNESSAATGVDGDESDTSATNAGAAYVFARTGTSWSEQAYVKASNTAPIGFDFFGASVSLSGSGDRLAVGAYNEKSGATGIDGDQGDTSSAGSGAAYVFVRAGKSWSQEAYVKASNTRPGAYFGCAVALSNDGSSLAVGSYLESSGATGIDGNQADTLGPGAGAVYVFDHAGTTWSQKAYVKPSNTHAGEHFGRSVALSATGGSLAVGAEYESSNAIGIDGKQDDESAGVSGAVYVY